MAKNICYYISDHGYGHAARSIAVIRALLDTFKDIHIFVKAFTAYDFLLNSLQDKRVDVIKQRNDVGVINNKFPFDVMLEGSLAMIKSWFKSWPDYIKYELEFCKKKRISLIITDVAPQPLEVACQLGIPSALISNFTWQNIYTPLFGKYLKEELALMRKMYSLADIAFVLPFEQKIKAKKVIPAGLVARAFTQSKSELRKSLGAENVFLVYFGVGFSMPDGFMNKLHVPKNVRVLVSSNSPVSGKGIMKIPSNVTESHNYIAMCDMAVIKSGYTTSAEAIFGGVPLIITKRKGFSDDNVISSAVAKLGIGKEISNEQFVNGDWLANAKFEADLLKQNYLLLPERFKNSGIPKIMEGIQQLIKQV